MNFYIKSLFVAIPTFTFLIIILVNYILSGDTFDIDSVDINNDGAVKILDVVALVNIIMYN